MPGVSSSLLETLVDDDLELDSTGFFAVSMLFSLSLEADDVQKGWNGNKMGCWLDFEYDLDMKGLEFVWWVINGLIEFVSFEWVIDDLEMIAYA